MSISAISSSTAQIQPQQVAASAVKAADGDGDGRRGSAALNDGDVAAQAAARTVSGSGHKVDIKA